jgi:hypothetical protein
LHKAKSAIIESFDGPVLAPCWWASFTAVARFATVRRAVVIAIVVSTLILRRGDVVVATLVWVIRLPASRSAIWVVVTSASVRISVVTAVVRRTVALRAAAITTALTAVIAIT